MFYNFSRSAIYQNYSPNFFFREKPHDTEWLELLKVKIPLLLNYSQCKLLQKEYYEVIEHCTEVLKHEPSESFVLDVFKY